MKVQAHLLQEAIERGDRSQAESILFAGLDLNPNCFVKLLRKEGILRFARYDFQTKILLPWVEAALSMSGLVLEERCRN